MNSEVKIVLIVLFMGKIAFGQTISIDWQKCYGGTDAEGVGPIIPMSGNSFIYVGGTGSNDMDVSGNHGGTCGFSPCGDVWLFNLDSSGNLLWQKCLGGSGNDRFTSNNWLR